MLDENRHDSVTFCKLLNLIGKFMEARAVGLNFDDVGHVFVIFKIRVPSELIRLSLSIVKPFDVKALHGSVLD